MSDNPLSDYLDKQIKEAATRVVKEERNMNIDFDFSFADCMKVGCGLAAGVLAAIGMAAFVVDVLKYLKQLLGI